MSAVTLTDFKTRMGISGTDQDVVIQSSLDMAQALVESYIKGKVEVTTVTEEFFDQEYVDTLYMPHWPLRSVDSVEKDGVTLVADTDYRVSLKRAALIFGNRCVPSGCCVPWANLLEVTYTYGWITSGEGRDLPNDLYEALMNIAISIYNEGGVVAASTSGSGELKSLTMFDAMSMSFDTGSSNGTGATGAENLVAQWAFVLDQYKMSSPVMA